MRAAWETIAINWRVLIAVYAGSFMLAWAFRLMGLCVAFILAIVLQHCVHAHASRTLAIKHLVEARRSGDDAADVA